MYLLRDGVPRGYYKRTNHCGHPLAQRVPAALNNPTVQSAKNLRKASLAISMATLGTILTKIVCSH